MMSAKIFVRRYGEQDKAKGDQSNRLKAEDTGRAGINATE